MVWITITLFQSYLVIHIDYSLLMAGLGSAPDCRVSKLPSGDLVTDPSPPRPHGDGVLRPWQYQPAAAELVYTLWSFGLEFSLIQRNINLKFKFQFCYFYEGQSLTLLRLGKLKRIQQIIIQIHFFKNPNANAYKNIDWYTCSNTSLSTEIIDNSRIIYIQLMINASNFRIK